MGVKFYLSLREYNRRSGKYVGLRSGADGSGERRA
jgi:hypothetical protein